MQVTVPAASDKSALRFAFLDGLRGLAALTIASYHIFRYEPDPKTSQQCLPWLLERWLVYGWVWVPCLLVISGFVIPLSFRDGRVTSRSVANFLVRRLVRLSPSYFVTLLIVLLLQGISEKLSWFPTPLDSPLSWGQVASHLIYAQDLLGFPNLSAGLWTVCMEVQFYVLFGVALLLSRAVCPIVTDGQATADPRVMVFLCAPLAVMSLCDWCNRPDLDPYVIYFFHHFFLGMVTWWALDDRIPRGWSWATVGIWLARLCWDWKPEVVCALVASLAIFTAGRWGHLHDWLNVRWLQYLGKISYSLYLIHYAVSHVVTNVGWGLLGGLPSPLQASACLAIALASSLVTAHLLYVWVEAPSAQWAARLKSPRFSFDARNVQAG